MNAPTLEVVIVTPAGACRKCGRPKGTGTLLDAVPESPRIGANRTRTPQDQWEEFAKRYRCPACDAHLEDTNEAVLS